MASKTPGESWTWAHFKPDGENMSALNPTLYRVLKHNLGPVTIADAGRAMVKIYSKTFDGRTRLVHQDAGEYYRVNCPFCNDHRQRLWINHLWGVYDPMTKSCNRWLAHCYNESCLADEENRFNLLVLTSSYHHLARSRHIDVAEGAARQRARSRLRPRISSGSTSFRRIIMPFAPPAWAWIRPRGTREEMVRWLSHEACPWSPLRKTGDSRVSWRARALSSIASWQARALVDGDDPKYYTKRKEMKKSQLLYLGSRAIRQARSVPG